MPAAGVIWEGGRRRSSDVTKYLVELADVMPAVWEEAIQKVVKAWAFVAALKITSAESNR
jgi:hypothetical protein